jgi:aminoglycoside 6'-N-acetyltransferase
VNPADTPPPGLRLRRATLADVPVLRRWDEDPAVVASDPKDDWDWDEELAAVGPWRKPLVAEVDGRPIGFLDVIDPAAEPTRYWGEIGPGHRAIDIWIGAAADRGRGYGAAMMRLALADCFASPDVHTVLIDPLADNVRAIRFYRRLGFRSAGLHRFGGDLCEVHVLDRAAWRASPACAAAVPE